MSEMAQFEMLTLGTLILHYLRQKYFHRYGHCTLNLKQEVSEFTLISSSWLLLQPVAAVSQNALRSREFLLLSRFFLGGKLKAGESFRCGSTYDTYGGATTSVTRLGNLLPLGQLFKAYGSNYLTQTVHIFKQSLLIFCNLSFFQQKSFWATFIDFCYHIPNTQRWQTV